MVFSTYMTLFYSMLLGMVGVLCRYFAMQVFGGVTFPWATLVVNAVGSAIIGYLFGSTPPGAYSPFMVAVMVGFLGALTTFSSFSLETLKLIQSGAVFLGFTFIIANNLLSLGLCFAGYFLGKHY
ncbi:MAG: CrcB family protein [Bdellovibrionales bacterium]|nr:CrcB family protein [Bdellovibrionales bacterium]